VIHDETVDRTTNGTGAVARMSLAEIRALDAGKGQSPPTLEEVLDVVRGRCGLLCELKADGTERPAVEAVRARGMGGEVLFISFGLERLANVKALDKDLRVGALLVFPTARNIRRALDVGASHLGVLYRRLSLEAVDRARAAGVDIGAWTVNSPEEMKAVIALGVTHVTSDRPDLLLEHLGRRKQA
jgi:glycerophosphoryl diester phosphodiesterase